jgi:DNA polymerase III delta subunit
VFLIFLNCFALDLTGKEILQTHSDANTLRNMYPNAFRLLEEKKISADDVGDDLDFLLSMEVSQPPFLERSTVLKLIESFLDGFPFHIYRNHTR